MALITLKTTVEHANDFCTHGRMFDIRPKVKNIKVGDVIRYEVWNKKQQVKSHSISGKRFKVLYVDGGDSRIMKDHCIFQLKEIEPMFV